MDQDTDEIEEGDVVLLVEGSVEMVVTGFHKKIVKGYLEYPDKDPKDIEVEWADIVKITGRSQTLYDPLDREYYPVDMMWVGESRALTESDDQARAMVVRFKKGHEFQGLFLEVYMTHTWGVRGHIAIKQDFGRHDLVRFMAVEKAEYDVIGPLPWSLKDLYREEDQERLVFEPK